MIGHWKKWIFYGKWNNILNWIFNYQWTMGENIIIGFIGSMRILMIFWTWLFPNMDTIRLAVSRAGGVTLDRELGDHDTKLAPGGSDGLLAVRVCGVEMGMQGDCRLRWRLDTKQHIVIISFNLFILSWCLGVFWCLGVLVSWCLGVLMSWCLGVLVSWCLGVLVSCCLGVLVSWCLGVLVSWCRKSRK